METKIKFHPMLFSTPMIQAILKEEKTQTRRVVKLPSYHPSIIEKQKKVLTIKDFILYDGNNENIGTIKSHYEVGDVLWARETFWNVSLPDEPGFIYKSDFEKSASELVSWKPSIFMPKEACRIFLKIKSIKVERLEDISEEDAKKEGVKLLPNGSYRNYHEEEIDQNYMYTTLAKISFETLWESIYGFEIWEFNPYVFVYEYERIAKPSEFII